MPASNVPFSSRMMRSAVFFPTPGMWDTRAMSWEAIASASSAGENVERAARAIFGPTFDTPISFSNSTFSSSERKPNSAIPFSVTDRYVSTRAVSPTASLPKSPPGMATA